MRTTYTYALLEVSRAAYDEIAAKLRAAGYGDAFHDDPEHGVLIDLHGLALVLAPSTGEPVPSATIEIIDECVHGNPAGSMCGDCPEGRALQTVAVKPGEREQ